MTEERRKQVYKYQVHIKERENRKLKTEMRVRVWMIKQGT